MVSAQASLDLFSAVFSNDIPKLKMLLSQVKCLSGTHRGQTLLTLAISLGNLEIVQMLLDAGASTLVKNDAGWNPFQEATSNGDRRIMELIYRQRRRELSMWFQDKGKIIMRDLSKDLNDFYLEMNWSFKSNIPYLSLLCPSVLV